MWPRVIRVLPVSPAPVRGTDMASKSKIETELSEDDLKDFRHLMATGRCSIDGLVDWLGKRGYEISRSSVGRYSQNFERVAARLRESRKITEAVTTELGEAAVQGQQGRLLVEMTRTLVFDLLIKLQEAQDSEDGDGAEISAKDVMMLGKGLADLGKALRQDQDFETKVREQIAAEERKKAADIVEQAASKAGKGLSRAAVDSIKAEILGVG
ncbi:hypothetical protein CSC3H3_15285 [Thalassospira marina]|uniref:Terminase n=2 Tax=Thalassospira marina TaxID=2048283 RepID=A0ABM6QBJ1_9PROT|nr:hypothetical protein CSC3H3_15285 [Thalassospira marina]